MSSTTEFQDVLVDELKSLGFAPIGRSKVMGAMRGEVCDVFFVRKSKWDESIQLVVGVWHPSLSSLSGRSLIETIKDDILGGDLSPWGVGEEKWWRSTDATSLDLFRRCIALGIRWMSPVRGCNDLFELAEFGHRKVLVSNTPPSLPRLPPIQVGLEGVPRPRRFTEVEQRVVLKTVLTDVFQSLGFRVREAARQFAFVRERGEFLDVIEPRNVSWGISTVLNCFVTTPDIGRIRPEIGNLLVQTNGGEVGLEGLSRGVRAIETGSLESPVFVSRLLDAVKHEALPFFETISTRDEFLKRLGMGWEGTIGQPLGELWKSQLHH